MTRLTEEQVRALEERAFYGESGRWAKFANLFYIAKGETPVSDEVLLNAMSYIMPLENRKLLLADIKADPQRSRFLPDSFWDRK